MKKSKLNIWFVVLAVCAFSLTNELLAQGPPINTDSPILLGLEGGGFRTFGKIVSTDQGETYIQPLAIPYNLTTDFQIGIIQPFISTYPKNKNNNSGFGNLSLFAKQMLLQIDSKAKTFRSLLKFTQTFPTGASSVSADVYSSQFMLVTGFVTLDYSLNTSIGYSFVSGNLPDNLVYNFAFGYPLLPQKYPPFQLNLYLELNGQHTFDVNKSILFFSPGIQLITSSIFLFESSFQFPIVDDSGIMKFTYSLGIRYLIF